jgi:hypothetical protein
MFPLCKKSLDLNWGTEYSFRQLPGRRLSREAESFFASLTVKPPVFGDRCGNSARPEDPAQDKQTFDHAVGTFTSFGGVLFTRDPIVMIRNGIGFKKYE